MLQKVLAEVNAYYMAFALDCEVVVAVAGGMDLLIRHPFTLAARSRKEFVAEVSACNRIKAFVYFSRGNDVVADVTFCEGKTEKVTLSIMFDRTAGKIRIP